MKRLSDAHNLIGDEYNEAIITNFKFHENHVIQ